MAMSDRPVTQRQIAVVMERKLRERDETTEALQRVQRRLDLEASPSDDLLTGRAVISQHEAVLTGELADLQRAMTSLTHGTRITKSVRAMLDEFRDGSCRPPTVPHQFIEGACVWCGLTTDGGLSPDAD